MSTSDKSLFKRIRSAKNSLDNAEQSFMDNKSMRGELDLMLAEAELKNLRKKKDVPWNWNRQILALCGAMLLAVAGIGGWMFAKSNSEQAEAVAKTNVVVQEKVQTEAKTSQSRMTTNKVPENDTKSANAPTKKQEDVVIKEKPLQQEVQQAQVSVSDSEMHQLVRSARVELSKTK